MIRHNFLLNLSTLFMFLLLPFLVMVFLVMIFLVMMILIMMFLVAFLLRPILLGVEQTGDGLQSCGLPLVPNLGVNIHLEHRGQLVRGDQHLCRYVDM